MSGITLQQLAEMVGGQVVGDAQTTVFEALPLQDAANDCLTLIDGAQNVSRVNASQAVAVVTTEAYPQCDKPMLVVTDLHASFAQISQIFRPPQALPASGVDVSASVDSSARIGQGVSIGPGVTIGADCHVGEGCVLHSGVHLLAGCRLGSDCTLFPNVTLYDNTQLGDRVIVHAGCVLGAFGFGYQQRDGFHVRGAQLGWVQVEDDCEIGANTTIDRGTYGKTRIGRGTKIDNLVQIGHNCHIGQHNIICAQVGIAGSSSTDDHVVLAGQVGVADHTHVGARVRVGAQAGIMRDVEPDQTVFGSPAIPRKQKMLEVAIISKLPTMRQQLRELQQQVQRLQSQSDHTDDASQRDAA